MKQGCVKVVVVVVVVVYFETQFFTYKCSKIINFWSMYIPHTLFSIFWGECNQILGDIFLPSLPEIITLLPSYCKAKHRKSLQFFLFQISIPLLIF